MKTVEDYVELFGEQYRQLIIDSLAFLDSSEQSWGLEEPIDREKYLRDLVHKIASIKE